jgi:hypothetical protein
VAAPKAAGTVDECPLVAGFGGASTTVGSLSSTIFRTGGGGLT